MLTENYIYDALQSEREGDRFPVDLDDVFSEFGYARKDVVVRKLKNSRLRENTDYTLHKIAGARRGGAFDKYFLSVDAFKSFLLTANTEEGEKARRYFIEVEKHYRANLERQLTLTASDIPGYTHTLDSLWVDSGIVSRHQVKTAITRDFIEGRHYHWEGKTIHLTEICYTVLMYSFRSKRGASKNAPVGQVNWDEFCQYEERKSANTRTAKRCDPNQLTLF